MHKILDQYLALLIEADRKPKTITNSRVALRRYDEWCLANGLTVAKVKPEELKLYLKDLGSVYLPGTVGRHFIQIRAAYHHAHELGQIKGNPSSGLMKLIPKVKEVVPRIYTGDEMRRIVTAAKGQDRVAIYLLAFTGCRAAELRALKWKGSDQDTFIDGDQIQVFGKGGKIRHVPIHPILKAVLDPLELASSGGHGTVIKSSWGHSMASQTWQNMIKRVMVNAGVDVEHPSHVWRKTLNTNLTRNKVRPDVIESIMGWSASSVRARFYTGQVTDDARAAILMAYSDEKIFPEQTHLIQKEELDEVETLRLRLAVLQEENENLRLKGGSNGA